jgi:RNA-dependent RNA polymerase
MNRRNGGYQRGGGQGKDELSSGRAGNRTYSGSSGSSSGQLNNGRPVLRPAPATTGRVTPADQVYRGPAQVDSPITPTREQSSFTMNGHSIRETYTPSGSSVTASPRFHTSPSSPTPNQRHHGGNTPSRQHAMQRPVNTNGESNWAALLDYKIKVLGMPKSSWTKQVHQAMFQYGNVVRIEMEPGSQGSAAYVTFQ